MNCKINMICVLRTLYNINILLTLVLISISTFKSEGYVFSETTWEQLLAPLYFYMTELLLVAIVSFVVFVNSVIQLCCTNSSRASRLSRNYNNTNNQESNTLTISNPSALVRVSLWFLYLSVCGLLCLFLLLKNAGALQSADLPATEQSSGLPDPAKQTKPTIGAGKVITAED